MTDIAVNIGDDCLCCWAVELDDETTVFYKDTDNSEWKVGGYCIDCTNHLLNTQWQTYSDGVKKADCRKSLRDSLENGPPINLRDRAFPCQNESKEVYSLKNNGEVLNPKLKDSLEGDERTQWWDHYKAILNALEDNPNQKIEVGEIDKDFKDVKLNDLKTTV